MDSKGSSDNGRYYNGSVYSDRGNGNNKFLTPQGVS